MKPPALSMKSLSGEVYVVTNPGRPPAHSVNAVNSASNHLNELGEGSLQVKPVRDPEPEDPANLCLHS